MKKERYLREMDDQNDNAFSLIADFDGNEDQVFDIKVGETLPVLPLRNMVLFPGVFMPVSVGRKSSLRLVREADKKKSYIAVVCQKMAETDEPAFEDLHPIGTIGKIVRVLEMPDQTTTVIIQGMKRLELKNITETHPYLKGEVNIVEEEIPSKDDKEFQALVETCKDLTIRYIKSSDTLHQESAFAIKNLTNHMFLVDFICTNLPLKKDEKIELLRIDSLRERTYRLLEILNREVQLAEIKASIQMRAREDIDQQQREYFLQRLWRAAQEFGIQTFELEERILVQMMYAGEEFSEDELFLHYYKTGGRELVVLAYITLRARAYFVKDEKITGNIMGIIRERYQHHMDLNDACKLALLKALSTELKVDDNIYKMEDALLSEST